MRTDPAQLQPQQDRFARAVAQLEEIAPPLRAHRRLTTRSRHGPHPADTIEAMHRTCLATEMITKLAATDPDIPADLATAIQNTSWPSPAPDPRSAVTQPAT
jgi:hypothetical protein